MGWLSLFFAILKIKGQWRLKKEKENKFKIQLDKKELVTTPMPNALPLHVNLTILSRTLFIRFYVVVEVEPYENGDGRAMEEIETCSAWERESRKKKYLFLGLEIGMECHK